MTINEDVGDGHPSLLVFRVNENSTVLTRDKLSSAPVCCGTGNTVRGNGIYFHSLVTLLLSTTAHFRYLKYAQDNSQTAAETSFKL